MEKVLFVDRDGVINVDLIGDYIKSWSEFKFEEGALEALKILYDTGYQIVIISNQAGVGDGIFKKEDLDDVHERMILQIEKAGIRIHSTHYCLHGKEEGCACRKPEIGLFKKASQTLDYDPPKTYFVGDKASDVEAGKRHGLKTIFVRTGHGKHEESKLKGDLVPDHIADNFLDAVEKFLV